jgi:hypothetical protein
MYSSIVSGAVWSGFTLLPSPYPFKQNGDDVLAELRDPCNRKPLCFFWYHLLGSARQASAIGPLAVSHESGHLLDGRRQEITWV